MKVSEVFAGSLFKSEDFDKKGRHLVIEDVREEKIGEEDKIAVVFKGEEKMLSLNKTNAFALADMFGDETDEWIGKTVVIYRDATEYKGKRVPCMRIGSASSKAA